MEKVHKGNGFAVIEKEGTYEISWSQGAYGHIVSYPISKVNMEKAFKSPRDAYEVMIYAETGGWPLTKDEELENKRVFFRKFPELLIKIPENQRFFSEEELEELLILARKKLEEK